jgi:hypothetical protein
MKTPVFAPKILYMLMGRMGLTVTLEKLPPITMPGPFLKTPPTMVIWKFVNLTAQQPPIQALVLTVSQSLPAVVLEHARTITKQALRVR